VDCVHAKVEKYHSSWPQATFACPESVQLIRVIIIGVEKYKMFGERSGIRNWRPKRSPAYHPKEKLSLAVPVTKPQNYLVDVMGLITTQIHIKS
jgi:hypothetical protein